MKLNIQCLIWNAYLRRHQRNAEALNQAARQWAVRSSTYTCPTCGRTSHNPNDARNRYCGFCHKFEDQ